MGPSSPSHLFKEIQSELSRVTPSLNSTEFIKHASPSKHLDLALGEWFDRACHIQVSSSRSLRVVSSGLMPLQGDQAVQMIDQALESGSPAVIHYDFGVLDAENPSIWQSFIGFHVSTIVARTDVSGARYFLLRNSWGSDCQIYAQQIARRCDRGHIWLTENEVRKYVTSVAYLRPTDQSQ